MGEVPDFLVHIMTTGDTVIKGPLHYLSAATIVKAGNEIYQCKHNRRNFKIAHFFLLSTFQKFLWFSVSHMLDNLTVEDSY